MHCPNTNRRRKIAVGNEIGKEGEKMVEFNYFSQLPEELVEMISGMVGDERQAAFLLRSLHLSPSYLEAILQYSVLHGKWVVIRNREDKDPMLRVIQRTVMNKPPWVDRLKIRVQRPSRTADLGFQFLRNVRNIDLSYHDGITNYSLPWLQNAWKVNLTGCKQISDAGLSYLGNVEEINLSWCHRITDEGLFHLRNVRKINLSHCDRITDEGLSYLENVRKINLTGCQKITELGLSFLKKVERINFVDRLEIANQSDQHLRRC